MRRHAKASSAGSNTRQAGGLGRIFRGAFAIRGVSGEPDGSGAPSLNLPRPLLAAAFAVFATLVAGVALAAAAAPSVTVENASNVGYTTADIEGTVKAEGQPTTWRFEYISDAKYQENLANSLPAFEGALTHLNFLAGSTETEETVVRQLGALADTVLISGTTYHLRLVAENADGQSEAVAASTFETKAMAAPTVTIEPVTEVTATSARFAGIVNPNAPGPAPQDEAFKVEWKFECSPSCFGAPQGYVAADNTDTPVGGTNFSQLSPNTEYTVTLRATNGGGLSGEDAEIGGEPVKFTTPALAPTVAKAPSMPLSAGSVRLRGYVNPRNSALSECRFAYSADNSFAQSAPCDPMPGVVDDIVEVSADLTDLVPGATYNFRLIATNLAGETVGDDATFTVPASLQPESCANAAFRTGLAAELPDCRAYEMVSPPDKNGGDVMPSAMKTRMSPDGNAAVFASLSGFGDVLGTGLEVDYASVRSPGGWSTHSLMPQQQPQPWGTAIQNVTPSYPAFSEDLTQGVLFAISPLTDAPNVAAANNLYRRSDVLTPGPGAYSLLTDSATMQTPNKDITPKVVAASEDFTQILFSSTLDLVPEAAPPAGTACDPKTVKGRNRCTPKLYEWDNGEIRLAGILPDGEPARCPEDDDQVCSGPAGPKNPDSYTATQSISDDGSRVIFASLANTFSEDVPRQLYMRQNHATTIRINASEKDTPEPQALRAQFGGSSTDNSKVFFWTGELLTNTDTDRGNANGLYMYDASRPASDPDNLTLISADQEPNDGKSVHVSGVIGVSDDGSYVYYVTSGQLVPGAPIQTAGSGALSHIYVWHDGVNRYIGTLNSDTSGAEVSQAIGDGNLLAPKTSRVTPDGRHMIFTSRDSTYLGLDGHDHGTGCGKSEAEPCTEVYVYDYDAGGLSCVSCDPSGGAATADASPIAEEGKSNSRSNNYLNHALSDDGRRVFFSSAAALAAEDTNGKPDAYQYDTEAGELHLLSSGTSPVGSFFLDASPSGGDVLIATREKFVRIVDDDAYDLYDVRVGGGIAAQGQPGSTAPECGGDACQGAAAPQRPTGTPASAGLRGSGDPDGKRRCSKNKRKVHRAGKTRCVKKQAKGRANQDRRAGR